MLLLFFTGDDLMIGGFETAFFLRLSILQGWD